MTSRISRISVFTHCNDLGGKVWNPAILWTKKYAVFALIEDTNGHRGLGECWCFDTAPDALLAFLRTEVLPNFIGQLVDDAFGIAEKLTERATLTARHDMLASALSGVDIAIWDIIANRQNQPMCQCLTTDGTGNASLYASGGLYAEGKTAAMLADEMAGHEQTGFRLSKMKVGAELIETDVKRVHAVLDILPEDAKLIIDGVYSYTADEALRLFDALPNERLEAFQSPTKAWDYTGMAALTKAGVPVMATEAEYRIAVLLRLIDNQSICLRALTS